MTALIIRDGTVVNHDHSRRADVIVDGSATIRALSGASSSLYYHVERREGGEHLAHSTLARRRKPVAGRVAGLVAVRPRLRRGGCLDNHRAWVVRHSVCRRGICHSVLSGGMGRGSLRSGSAGGTLDGWLRVGIGHDKQYGIGHAGDLVWSLGTKDRSRFHHLVARSLASPSQLRRVVAWTLSRPLSARGRRRGIVSAAWTMSPPLQRFDLSLLSRQKSVQGLAAPHMGDFVTMRF
jgi:hypothetical protein